MLRHVTEPVDTGRLQAGGGLEPLRHCPVDNGLLLLVEAFDKLAFIADKLLNFRFLTSQISHDIGLFLDWRKRRGDSLKSVVVQAVALIHDAV